MPVAAPVISAAGLSLTIVYPIFSTFGLIPDRLKA
jgi:hypothetical protein